MKTSVTKAECLAELQRVARLVGHSPTTLEFDKLASVSARTPIRRFGSWNEGLKAAGLKVIRRTDITKTECLSELKRVAKMLSHTPTPGEFNRFASVSQMPVITNFGSWSRGLKAAGL